MTKQEETAEFDRIVAAMPEDSYLRLYFGSENVREAFLYAIRCDLPMDLQAVNRHAIELKTEVTGRTARIAELKTEEREARMRIASLSSIADDLKESAADAGTALRRIDSAAVSMSQAIARHLEAIRKIA